MLPPPPLKSATRANKGGFTLIELSIVLVIVGLIIGGILVGQSLIEAAGVRAQISQIQQYNTAVRTFQVKYGYLPGDIPEPSASGFGFVARGTATGTGDGNGKIEGCQCLNGNNVGPTRQATCEAPVVWRDLSAAQLIDGSFTTASPSYNLAANITGAAVGT